MFVRCRLMAFEKLLMLQLCELCQDGVGINSRFEFLMNLVTFKEVYIASLMVLK